MCQKVVDSMAVSSERLCRDLVKVKAYFSLKRVQPTVCSHLAIKFHHKFAGDVEVV